MPRDYTPFQREAIQHNGTDLCIAAGAGSGKTGVLVERFLRIILDSKAQHLPRNQCADTTKILVITFTEKATKEMKQRIVTGLNAKGLIEERRSLETAYISTIHGFCSRLLQENPFEAGVDPSFQVMDTPQSRRLFRQTFEKALANAFTEQDMATLELIATSQKRREAGSNSTEPTLSLIIALEAVIARLRGAGRTYDELEKHWMQGQNHTAHISEQIIGDCLAGVKSEIETAYYALANLQNSLQGNTLQLYRALHPLFEENRSIQDTLVSLNQVSKAIQHQRTASSVASSVQAEIHSYFQHIRMACENVKHFYTFQAEYEAQAKVIGHRFWGFLVKVWRAFEQEKLRLGVLDSDDLLSQGVTLLERSPEVRARYREQFRHILVDEFQDTNPLQMRLVDLLHLPEKYLQKNYRHPHFLPTTEETTRNYLFLVGDVQQSIYAFRNADPTLFRDIERRFREGKQGKHVSLSVNFRSRPEVLQLITRVFGQIWRDQSTPFVPLTSGASFVAKPNPSIEIILTGNLSREEYVGLEAVALANRIAQIVENQEIKITAEQDERCGEPLTYRDIAVLLRATTQIEVYERAFAQRGIPFFVASAGKGYYARHEVRDVMNLLIVLDTPLDDVALVATLRSPFVGAELDTLYHLIMLAESRQKSAYSLYQYLPELIESSYLPHRESEKLRAFLHIMEELRTQEDRLPVGHLLERLFRQTSYDARLVCRPGGRRRLANVRKLLQMANSESVMGVREFILRLRDLQKVSEREGDAPTAEEAANVVRFFTIHGAKGLEFPLVALADMSRPIAMPERRMFNCDPSTFGLGTRVSGEGDLAYRTLQRQRQAEDRQEAERVLYVGMTRAKEHLLLLGNRTGFKSSLGDAVFEILGLLEPPQNCEETLLAGGLKALVAPTNHYIHENEITTPFRASFTPTHYAEEVLQELLREEERRIEEAF